MTNGLRIRGIHKNKLYKNWLQSKSHDDEIKYKDYKKVYTKAIKTRQKEYYYEIFNNKNTCDVIKCEMLNDYFASQCNVNSSVNSEINDGEDDDVNLTACELSDVVVTDSAILKALKMLDANKASGPDGIHNIVIKSCAETIIRPLKNYFQSKRGRGNISVNLEKC